MEITENEYVVTLITLNQGAAVELFDKELKRVLDNIADVNCDAKTKREITLKVAIKPDEDRKKATATLTIQSKLAAPRPEATAIYFGKVDGQIQAIEVDPDQGRLFDKKTGGVVATFEKGAGA